MQPTSAAPRGLCEICRGCVGGRHIQSDTGNKTKLAETQSEAFVDTEDPTTEMTQINSTSLQILSALVTGNLAAASLWARLMLR